MELDFKVQTRSECRKKQTRFLHTGQISFHEKVKKQTNKKMYHVPVNHKLNTWQLNTVLLCHVNHGQKVVVQHQMSTRENMFSKHQQALVHHTSARILCTVPCMVLLIHVQGNYRLTGGGHSGVERRKSCPVRKDWQQDQKRVSVSHLVYRNVALDSAAVSESTSLPAEILHHWPPSFYACFKYCSLSSVSACEWERDKVFRCPSIDVGNGS